MCTSRPSWGLASLAFRKAFQMTALGAVPSAVRASSTLWQPLRSPSEACAFISMPYVCCRTAQVSGLAPVSGEMPLTSSQGL